jgi:hypothetical protein
MSLDNIIDILRVVLDILRIVSWPLVVFILAGVIFRENIKKLLGRITQLKGPGGIALEAGLGMGYDETIDVQTSEVFNQKPANLFWFAADLRWVQMAILSGIPDKQYKKAFALQGLQQALHHASELELGKEVTDRLTKLIEIAKASDNLYFDDEDGLQVYREVGAIINAVGGQVGESQEDYKPRPES